MISAFTKDARMSFLMLTEFSTDVTYPDGQTSLLVTSFVSVKGHLFASLRMAKAEICQAHVYCDFCTLG